MSLQYRRLGRADLGTLATLQLDPEQVERFLGPLADIEAAVRRGPAHLTVALDLADGRAGFYVMHPDARDPSCWWLGWLALDVRQQGRGYGAMAVQHALQAFRRISFCHRVRLLVAPENLRARGLYKRAGFGPVGHLGRTGEIILELALPGQTEAEAEDDFALAAVSAGARRVFRHRRLRFRVGPHAAWVIGVERGPPSRASTRLAEHRIHGIPVIPLARDHRLGPDDLRPQVGDVALQFRNAQRIEREDREADWTAFRQFVAHGAIPAAWPAKACRLH